jgi:hybrid cluster-associated redox disulfide protein
MNKINKQMIIGEVLNIDRGVVPILMQAGMHCLGCPSSQMESIEDACLVHGIDADELVEKLNNYILKTVQ